MAGLTEAVGSSAGGACISHPPQFIQPHFTVHHIPEQTLTMPCAQGDKIHPGAGIIVSAQTDGSAVMEKIFTHESQPNQISGISRSLQIFLARKSLISEWRGTVEDFRLARLM